MDTDDDEDWNCPWPLNWQRRYRILADLVNGETDPVPVSNTKSRRDRLDTDQLAAPAKLGMDWATVG